VFPKIWVPPNHQVLIGISARKKVGGIPIPLKNMSSSVGLIIPTYSKYRGNIKNVPNHQPDGEFMKKTWKDPWERSMNDEKG
jgi:hypothetical protein